MKNYRWNYLLSMAVLACSACSQNAVEPKGETGHTSLLPKEKATVYFHMNATAFKANPQTRATQDYGNIENLRILAFRQNAAEYLYIGEVDKSGITYEGTSFTGKAQLPVGTYRFIPAYGLPLTSDANLAISTIGIDTPYSDTLTVSHLNNGVLPAIFLQQENVNVKDYVLGIDSKQTNTEVSLNLNRAIARLDIQFVQGQKKDASGNYSEIAGPVFGTNTDLESLTLDFEGLNSMIKLTNGGIMAGNNNPLNTRIKVNLAEARTDGKGSQTIYGKPSSDGKAYDYEAIDQGDFINGSAHIYGPFLFPYQNEETEGCALSMILLSTPDKITKQVYSRTIHIDKVPLCRNKVTLVRIYSGGDDIFHTGTSFEIIINEAWENHVEISGSVE